MPATATKRKLSDAEKRKATLANLISDNAKQGFREFGSGVNDVLGRGTIAGLLGAPADIANIGENALRALLNKPSVTAWGGSEHIGQKMQDYGLVSDVRRPKTEMLASLISPAQLATASLKAPKYAKTMLGLLDNLDAPSSMRNWAQRGAIDVWHGSPHKFDEFKAMDNIGGGEGAQAYGHGGYHASNPEVAKVYQAALSEPKYHVDGRELKGNEAWAAQFLHSFADDALPKRIGAQDAIEKASKTLGDNATKNEIISHIKELDKRGVVVENGNLYRNQLRWPDPAREAADPLSDKHFLDWDKPLSEQDASVQALLPDFSGLDRPVTSLQGRIRLPDGSFADSEQQLSRALSARGIPGIRYLDGGSRSAGQGSHNYVTFDDALVNIMERNGQPVGLYK